MSGPHTPGQEAIQKAWDSTYAHDFRLKAVCKTPVLRCLGASLGQRTQACQKCQRCIWCVKDWGRCPGRRAVVAS